jgi:uncharacterized protein YjbI with pentapeptide repeats
MADKAQVKRLLAGVEGWNKWRKENPQAIIDLRGAKLDFAHLKGINLKKAFLIGTTLQAAHLSRANLSEADLSLANISRADLSGTNFRKANLDRADLRRANLWNANLKKSLLSFTDMADIDLSETKGLDEVEHYGPSNLATSTFQCSKGKIPEKFLKKCGLSDWEVESVKLYQPELSTQDIDTILYRVHDLRVGQALQINPLFISYTHKDGMFVDAMEKYLDEKGIRFWRDIHDATAGPLEKIVDRAMRLNPTVFLVLSKDSVCSDWVEHEAESARELEKELGRHVLCPVALDDAWKDCK